MKESGLGTPATRAATIENLLDKEYLLREGKALRATDKGLALIRMLGDHQLTRPDLTGGWEKRLRRDGARPGATAPPSCATSGASRPRRSPGSATRTARRCASSGARSAPARRCDGTIVERPKSYSCTSWKSTEEPGLRLHDLEAAGRPHDQPRGGGGARRSRARTRADLDAERDRHRPLPDPGLRRRDRGARQELRLHVVEEPHGAGLRLRDLEARRAAPARTSPSRRRAPSSRAGKTNAEQRSSEPLGACPTPGCGGQIVENSRAFGCTSWKSRKETGCGFVIWKRQAGREVSREEAAARLEEARAASAAVPAGTK